jgi:hypothetical protein
LSNWGKYRHRGTAKSAPAALTLVSGCFDATVGSNGGARLTFSENIETFGVPAAADVTARRAIQAYSGVAVVSVAGTILVVSFGLPGLDAGSDFVTLAANAANWLRSSLSRVPVTAPVTLNLFGAC